MSRVTDLHSAVKQGDVTRLKALLAEDGSLANAVSETDVRGTYPLHVAAEFGQADAVPAAPTGTPARGGGGGRQEGIVP